MAAASSVVIRAATGGDLETVVEFNRRLAEETESKVLDVAVLRRGVARVLGDSSLGFYLVACSRERIVAQAMITYEWSDWRDGMIWWFQSVYVDTPLRGRGIFRKLFEAVVERASRDDDVVGLRLYVENENERAQAVYEKLGLRAAGYRVHEMIPLRSAGSPED